MKDVDEWRRETTQRSYQRQRTQAQRFPGIVEELLEGKALEAMVLPTAWEEHLNDLIEAAQQTGSSQRERQLEALRALFRFQSHIADIESSALLRELMEISAECDSSPSMPVKAFVYGSLGLSARSRGFEKESRALTQKAVEAAREANLRSAELQWAVNLAILEADRWPRETAHDLQRLLAEARIAGDETLVGLVLSNLAVVHDHLSQTDEAIRYQEEATSIAVRIGDRRAEMSRRYQLAQLEERAGMIEAALRNYDRGLAAELQETGLSRTGMEMLRHVAKQVAEQHRDPAREKLASHVRFMQGRLSRQNIQEMLEQAEMGRVMTGSEPGNRERVSVAPDNAFARRLADRKEWGPLAVYAYYWTDKGFAAGDHRGYHWLALALRGLGLAGAADASISLAMEMERYFNRISNE